MSAATKYYPSLSTVVTLEDFPENLGFIKEGIKQIFEKVYIKDFQANISPKGESGFYGLSIVSKETLKFKIPGTEIAFILNPDKEDQAISSFPVTVEYQWLVLSYLKSFDLDHFSFSAREFYELGLQILNVSEEEVISLVINNFVTPSTDSLTKVEQFVNDLNNELGLTIPVPVSDNKARELVLAIKNQFSNEASIAAFLLYFLDESNLENSINNVKNFYKLLIPEDIDSYIKNIITPKARVTLSLKAAIELPHSILKPINENGSAYTNPAGELDPNTKTRFKFAEAMLYADTQEGFGYQAELGGSLEPKYATIANTGLIIEIDSLKLDLSKKTNIAEADADGRPADFVGVYARKVSVTLPPKWFKPVGSTAAALQIGASDLLVGTGGLSGNIYLEAVPVVAGNGYYNNKFDFIYPITMFEKNITDKVVKEKKIASYEDLLVHLGVLNTAHMPQAFKFPLKLITKASPPVTHTFNTDKEYQAYLSTLVENTLWKTIGSEDKGFKVGFKKFDISFKQNKVIESNIKGVLEIPKLKNKNGEGSFHVDIEGHLSDNGDFDLSASFSEGSAPEALLFNLINLKFNSLHLGKEDKKYYIGTSCEISFAPRSIMGELLGDIKYVVEKLRIYSDGSIEVEGGSIPLPVAFALDLGAVKMGVSHINFGSTEIEKGGQPRKYNFWGFDGAISLNPLGFDARGEGIKYYYCVDDDYEDDFLHIQTIEVDLVIPAPRKDVSGAASKKTLAIIHGMLSLPQPGKSQEFIGKISVEIPDGNISGSADMKFMPKEPAFLIDANMNFPTPIPLGFISISAFRGLIGFRYVATKEAAGLTQDKKWYDYYKAPKKGVNIDKFTGPPASRELDSPFSIGAGGTFGTTADGGYISSIRAFFLLSIPNLFYLEAGVNLLSSRLKLIEEDTSNPPFFAVIAYSDDSLTIDATASFGIPKDSGKIVSLEATLAAGFYFKNQKPWYVNLGTRENPIMAKILSIIYAKSFIMLSAQGIEIGARIDYSLKKKFLGAKVDLWAALEMGGKISFKRSQMGGYLYLGGRIKLDFGRVFRIELGLDATFSVESFKPFLVYTKLEVTIRVKISRIRISKRFKVEIQWEFDRSIDAAPYSPLPKGTRGDAGDNRTMASVKGIHMLTNQAFNLHYSGRKPNDPESITEIIPLDTFIDIKFNKGVVPALSAESVKIGGQTSGAKNCTDLMPPIDKVAGRTLRQVRHEYSITKMELKSWVPTPGGGSWEDYNPFEALMESGERHKINDNHLRWAYWQKVIDQYDSIRVMAANPFSFLSAGQPGWHVPEQYGITPSTLFCVEEKIEEESTVFLNKDIGQRYYIPTQREADEINGLFFKIIGEIPEVEEGQIISGDYMVITGESNPFGYNRSLSFKNYNQLEIIFPGAAIEPSLFLTTHAATVMIKAYTAVVEDNKKFASYAEVPLRKTTLETTGSLGVVYTKDELSSKITLLDAETDPSLKTKIDKVVVIPVIADSVRIFEIRQQLALLETTVVDEAYDEETDMEIIISEIKESEQYTQLLAELALLNEAACDCNNTANDSSNEPLTFTHYYGYKGNDTYSFDHIFKYNDTYLISFHPQANTTAIVQIDANGKLLRERLLNGIVTSMQVLNDNLIITQALDVNQCKGISFAEINDDFVVGCSAAAAATAIVELDSELNQVFGIQYPNTYSLAYNKLFTLADNELLWINTLAEETQINWLNSSRSVLSRNKIDEAAIKVLQHSANEFSLITKDKKIIRFGIDSAAKTVSVISSKVISDTAVSEITDAAVSGDKIIIGVKLTSGKFALAQIEGNETEGYEVEIVKNDTIFDTAVYLSNHALDNHYIIAYNKKHIFLFDDTLDLKQLIERDNGVEGASIIDIQNEPSVNQILMLSHKANEKGVYFSLFNNVFDNCALHSVTAPDVMASPSSLSSITVNASVLANGSTSDYTRKIKDSNLITINDIICSKGGYSGDGYDELDCTTYLQRVNWMTQENYFYNATIPSEDAVKEDKKAMVYGVQEVVQPIWRPNTTYYLHFTLKDKVSRGKSYRTSPFDYYYGFKTSGPLGHYSIPEPAVEPEDSLKLPVNGLADLSKSPLASLRQYLDYRRSYPNADGSLLQAKPVYYGNHECKIALYFTNPYVYHMFKDWSEYNSRPALKGVLNLYVKDPLTDMLMTYPLEVTETKYPKPDETKAKWEDDNDPRIPADIKLLNNFINAVINDSSIMKCSLELGDPVKPKSYAYTVELTDLKPLKMYTLLVNNFFNNEQKLVHQFGFQTSRYKNFEEQINSYWLGEKDENGVINTPDQALFNVNVDIDEDHIDALYYLVSGQTVPLNSLAENLALNYHDKFDRAIEGILKLSPLDPAQHTEVNRIVNTNTGEIIALLIRNPEPFNIPKIPLEEIQDTIFVKESTTTEIINGVEKVTHHKDNQYKVLHSKDYAQVLVMNTSKNITASHLDFKFEYRIWNTDGVVPLTKFEAQTLLSVEL